ncbi:MAG: hypothetical protein AAFS10_13845, partial [Myxococcota bacterium]
MLDPSGLPASALEERRHTTWYANAMVKNIMQLSLFPVTAIAAVAAMILWSGCGGTEGSFVESASNHTSGDTTSGTSSETTGTSGSETSSTSGGEMGDSEEGEGEEGEGDPGVTCCLAEWQECIVGPAELCMEEGGTVHEGMTCAEACPTLEVIDDEKEEGHRLSCSDED